MNQLRERLKAVKAKETFEKIGLDYKELFADLDTLDNDPYRNHTWVIKDSDVFLVVNAIPEDRDQDHLFWEEWYLQKDVNEIHHHILTLFEPETYHEIYQAPEEDTIHPFQCFGKKWFVVEDPNMIPILLRR